jgi:tetratricopeptide (TPR) repeat protein
MKLKVLVAAAVLLSAASVLAAAPRIGFVRALPATYDLAPAERLTVIYAIGDTEQVFDFVADFIDAVGRAGAYSVENAAENNRHLIVDDAALQALRREHPADAYLGVTAFTCRGTDHSAEGSERDTAGERVKRLHHWVDVACEARVHVMGGEGKRLFSYTVRGEGTSPRSTALTSDERAVAYAQGAHYAAVTAAQAITPRRIRESIELDDTAPSFDEAYSMIASNRLHDARAIWEAALPRHRDSAALHYDLGAVCEAAGDLKAARQYFQSAVKLSSGDKRYAREFDLFRKRNARFSVYPAR